MFAIPVPYRHDKCTITRVYVVYYPLKVPERVVRILFDHARKETFTCGGLYRALIEYGFKPYNDVKDIIIERTDVYTKGYYVFYVENLPAIVIKEAFDRCDSDYICWWEDFVTHENYHYYEQALEYIQSKIQNKTEKSNQ